MDMEKTQVVNTRSALPLATGGTQERDVRRGMSQGWGLNSALLLARQELTHTNSRRTIFFTTFAPV